MRSTSCCIIFLPLTVAATVLSGEFELEAQAAPKAATAPISTERVNSLENLCTSFAPVEQLVSQFRLFCCKEQASGLFYCGYAAFATLPPLMHLAHTRWRSAPPLGSCTRTDCKFGLNLRRVLLFACETLLPNCGPLPQTSHLFAMIIT